MSHIANGIHFTIVFCDGGTGAVPASSPESPSLKYSRHKPFRRRQKKNPRSNEILLSALKREKRYRQMLLMADTTHVGWKTEPVKDDQGIGLEWRSRPGTDWQLTGQGRPVCLHDQLDAVQPLATEPRHEDGPSLSRTAQPMVTRRKRCRRPPLDVINGPQGPTSAGKRSIALLAISAAPRSQSTTASHCLIPDGRRRVDPGVF
jgi:hypothetical protein